uniref:Chromosome partitioning protein ParA n=2 Tax=unclassified Prevotella TaxID=2638335 RepID=A0AB33IZN1_9BACT
MKKIYYPLIIIGLLLVAGIVYLSINLHEQQQQNKEMQELAELDKKEMENEYQQFANQYSEMKSQISNDSIVAQLTAEQEKTQRLLDELKSVKSSDAREIARLKRELATVRQVLRSYVLEIDSLNRLNQNLTAENTHIRGQYEEATKQIEGLSTEKASLSQKVAIAAQLDATGINMILKNRRGKTTDKVSKCTVIQVNFSLAKNVTAASGTKTVYVKIVSPTGSTLGESGSFDYENRTLTSTMRKSIEYGGQETPVTLYWNVTQALEGGTYVVSIFADGNMIGSRNFTFK